MRIVCSGKGLFRTWAGFNMGWTGHGMVLQWAVISMFSAVHGLCWGIGSVCGWLGMSWSGYSWSEAYASVVHHLSHSVDASTQTSTSSFIIGFTAPDVSGGVTLSGQANQGGAVLPSYRITKARFDGHSVNITCTWKKYP
jgi:hypothetical protein